MDVGLELRQARERLGLRLETISTITKISPRVLQAIEACEGDRLPALVCTRGFVKSYAAEVGLNPDDTMRRYSAQFEETDDPAPAEPWAEPARPPIPPPATDSGPRRPPARVLYGRFGAVTTIVIVGIALLTAFGARRPSLSSAPSDVRDAPVSAAGLAPSQDPQPVPIATSGTAPVPADALHIAIVPSAPCWVGATVGDQQVFAVLLNAGERRTIDAASDVTLRVGDPAACAMTINGRPATVPGAPGQATTIRVTRQNYAQFAMR